MYRNPRRCEFYLACDICREILLAKFLGEDFLARRNSQCWVSSLNLAGGVSLGGLNASKILVK